MNRLAQAFKKPSVWLDIADYIVITMAIVALLAILLGSTRIIITALLVIACTEATEIPNTSREQTKRKENKESK